MGAKLEKASVEKSEVDKAKGKTLDEISAIVQQINAQLKEKKNKLAPQIKALRSVRQSFQQVEVKYMEKKTAYDQARSSIDAEIQRIAGEVKQLETDVLDGEQGYHELNMQLSVTESRLGRAAKEHRCLRKEEIHSNQFATLTDQYSSEISKLDEYVRDYRKH